MTGDAPPRHPGAGLFDWSGAPVAGDDGAVIGALIIVVVLVAVIPPLVVMSCAGIAAGLGWLLKADVDESHEGSELLDLNT